MNKKAIAILGAIFLLIMGTLGFLIYSKYGGKKTTTTDTAQTPASDTSAALSGPGTTGDNTASATPATSGGAVKLADDLVVSPILFYNGKGVTYFNNQGQLFLATINPDDKILQLTEKKTLDIPAKSGASKILWPSKGNNFIVEFKNSDGKKSWSFFNSETGAFTDLPPQIISVDWLPGGDKIVLVWSQDGKAVMEQADPDGQNWKKIADMWEPDDSLHVSPDGQSVLYYEENNASSTNFIVQTTPDGKFWKSLVQNGYNYGVLWSPDSNKFLFGRKNLDTQNMQLWYYDLLTGEVKNTGLNTTPEKAVWSRDSQAFYAAVPFSGQVGSNLLTVDNFVKIDAATFIQKEFKTGSTNVDGRDLFLSLDGTRLFFKNAQDGGLYYLDLNQ
jgi:hypothetical protein